MPVSITVGVPAYSRPDELRELIESVLACELAPDELLICEDASPERNAIRRIAYAHQRALEERGCRLRYVENERNLGYDGNLRMLIALASSDYLLLLGNDDQLYPGAIAETRRYIEKNPDLCFISRTYRRFSGNRDRGVLNETWLANADAVFHRDNSSPRLIFRLCGFVGGLIVKTRWARSLATSRYDGSLYYQYYLACHAYFGTGIGYIGKAIVAGRAENPPLFGHAAAEAGIHVPGAYRPTARARMWRGVLDISADVERALGVSLVDAVMKEMAGRQSFHIFEMMPAQGRRATLELFVELKKLGLVRSPLPWLLASFVLTFGSAAALGFRTLRYLQFKVERSLRIKC
ncbi:glycosyltransferase family 2 protein [Burkholderia oklahomensis]|uniref:glycosyltransferase family 2 protein n=1 Tax=Burkholderia oklahomensis TaxID=342113 RepID=UPI002656705E|nr:glycosyltransferase family 2 protein [Burkholderia oklahomensis]MDN7671382.1 glycosyltransferase family 2 protein [Burkholderia oklahomensis]